MDKSIIFSKHDNVSLYAVHLDEILPIRAIGMCFECEYFKDKKIKDINDIVFAIYKKKNIRDDYIVGSLVMINGRPYFKPVYFDDLFLLVSESAIFDVERFHNDFFPYYADYNSPFNEVKVTDLLTAYKIPDYFVNYPEDYVTSMDMRNLVLNNPLCVEISFLRKLSSLEDDGEWEMLFNSKFSDDYARELIKRKIFAQKDLINDYLNIDYHYYGLNPEDTKVKRKEMIAKLF